MLTTYRNIHHYIMLLMSTSAVTNLIMYFVRVGHLNCKTSEKADQNLTVQECYVCGITEDIAFVELPTY